MLDLEVTLRQSVTSDSSRQSGSFGKVHTVVTLENETSKDCAEKCFLRSGGTSCNGFRAFFSPSACAGDAGINVLYDRWTQSFANFDKALLETTYTEDAVFLAGESAKPIQMGRSEVIGPMRALIDKSMADGTRIDFRFRVSKRHSNGDATTDAGYYRITMTSKQPGTDPRRIYGKFVVVSVRQPDGHWAARFDAASGAPPEA